LLLCDILKEALIVYIPGCALFGCGHSKGEVLLEERVFCGGMSRSAQVRSVKYWETISRLQSSHIPFDTLLSAMETGAPAVVAPVMLAKSGKPRKPYVMTAARKEALEKMQTSAIGIPPPR
jgi:hypothetical protein